MQLTHAGAEVLELSSSAAALAGLSVPLNNEASLMPPHNNVDEGTVPGPAHAPSAPTPVGGAAGSRSLHASQTEPLNAQDLRERGDFLRMRLERLGAYQLQSDNMQGVGATAPPQDGRQANANSLEQGPLHAAPLPPGLPATDAASGNGASTPSGLADLTIDEQASHRSAEPTDINLASDSGQGSVRPVERVETHKSGIETDDEVEDIAKRMWERAEAAGACEASGDLQEGTDTSLDVALTTTSGSETPSSPRTTRTMTLVSAIPRGAVRTPRRKQPQPRCLDAISTISRDTASNSASQHSGQAVSAPGGLSRSCGARDG